MAKTQMDIDMESIVDVLRGAETWNLEVEIIYFALQNMKNNPKITITEAMQGAYRDWVK